MLSRTYNKFFNKKDLINELNALIVRDNVATKADVAHVAIERNIGHITLEEITGEWFTWYNKRDNVVCKLDRETYDELTFIFDEYWKKTGEKWEEGKLQ